VGLEQIQMALPSVALVGTVADGERLDRPE